MIDHKKYAQLFYDYLIEYLRINEIENNITVNYQITPHNIIQKTRFLNIWLYDTNSIAHSFTTKDDGLEIYFSIKGASIIKDKKTADIKNRLIAIEFLRLITKDDKAFFNRDTLFLYGEKLKNVIGLNINVKEVTVTYETPEKSTSYTDKGFSQTHTFNSKFIKQYLKKNKEGTK